MITLVTGASGFVGRQVLRELALTGHEVHATARTPDLDLPATWHAADLLNSFETVALIEEIRPTHLVHLAWVTEHGAFWESDDNGTWADATLHLLEAFGHADGRRAIIVGSGAEYDWSDPALRTSYLREDVTPLRPMHAYGRARVDAYHRAIRFSEASDVGVAWARLFFLFGTCEDPRRLVPSIIRAALAGRQLELNEPDNVLDFMSTTDAAAALVRLLESGVCGAVNIASGHGVRLAELAATIARLAGIDGPPPRPTLGTDHQHLVADIARLSTEVGFRPKYDLEASLAPVVTWWREQNQTIDPSKNVRLP